MSVDLYSVGTMLLGATGLIWVSYGLAQIHATWASAKQRVALLVEAEKREARALLKAVGEIERLDNEIREGRSAIDATVKATAARREELARLQPPPPIDIFVTSEFPASKRDRAWVVRMKPAGEGARAKSDIMLVVWAADHPLALARGRQVLGRRGYEAEAANRLG